MFKDDEKTTKLKNLLYSYTYIGDEIEGINENIINLGEVISAQRDLSIPCLTGMPSGSGTSDTVYAAVEKIVDTYSQEVAKLENRLDKAFRKRNYINVLLSVLNSTEKRIVELRYFKKYKIWMIGSCLHYDRSHIYRLHDEAFEKMLKVYSNE